MSKFSKKIVTCIIVFLSIVLLLPLTWIFCTNIIIDWATLTEEWYKILLSSFVSSVLFGFIAFLFIEFWKTKNQQHEIGELITTQKNIAKEILQNFNLENLKTFLTNHNQIVLLQPNTLYLVGIIKGDIVIPQMDFYIRQLNDDILRNKAKDDIIIFCENFHKT